MTFHVGAARRVADAGFLALDEVEIVGPDGDRHQRTVVRHPGAVVIVPVTASGTHALVVRQYRAAPDAVVLEVPAGKRDVDGEPPRETARRELAEEIGMVPGRLVKLAEFFNTPGFCDEYTHLYCALDLTPAGERPAQTAEEAHLTVEELALGDVEALVARRELIDAKSIIGLLLTRAYLAGAHPGVTEAG
jgi:ADP-ribose pyrophosphatase